MYDSYHGDTDIEHVHAYLFPIFSLCFQVCRNTLDNLVKGYSLFSVHKEVDKNTENDDRSHEPKDGDDLP